MTQELQEQQLGHDAVGDRVVDAAAKDDDSVLQQATVDVHGPFFTAMTLYDVGNRNVHGGA